MSRKRLTDAAMDRLLALAQRQVELGNTRLAQLGEPPVHDDATTPISIGDAIDLYGNGENYVCMAITDDHTTCTLQKINTSTRNRFH